MRINSTVILATSLAALSSVGAAADPGHAGHDHASETAFGRPGEAARNGRVIQIAMREAANVMTFSPSRIEIARGEQIHFVLRNSGEFEHELVIGTVEANQKHAEAMADHPDMVHDDPNARRLAPRTSAVLRWQFTQPGTFEYACLIPGHREAGMVGTVIVK